MPPTFAYIAALMVYLAVAALVWAIALCLALVPSKRPLARRLAAGMAGSFPGVFLFQILCAPIVALALLLISGVALLGRPPDVMIAFLVLLLISIPAVASLRGFYLGWRAAWEWAAGRSPMEFLQSDWLLGPISRRLFRGARVKAQSMKAILLFLIAAILAGCANQSPTMGSNGLTKAQWKAYDEKAADAVSNPAAWAKVGLKMPNGVRPIERQDLFGTSDSPDGSIRAPKEVTVYVPIGHSVPACNVVVVDFKHPEGKIKSMLAMLVCD